jgi:hypothetical protein
MIDQLFVLDILKNPVLLAAIIAIVRNILGYATECFNAKKLLPYSATKFLETLTLYETFFIILGGIASTPETWTAGITVAIDVLRSVKKAVELSTTAATTTK